MSGGGADVPWTPGLGACRSLQAFRSILSCLFGLTRANLGGVARHEELRHQPGPAGLVRRTDTAARVAVEVLIEEDVVPEVRVGVSALIEAVDRSASVRICKEQPSQTAGDLVGNLVEGREVPRARRALDPEVITVVVMELLQGLNDEEIDRKP